MAPKLKFIEGEKVLCFHGPLIYVAKCLKISTTKEKQTKYLIHYAGWNKNWDEWVAEACVLKYNEANCLKQKEVLKAHNLSVKTKKGSLKKKVDADDIASLSKLIDQASTSKDKDKEEKQTDVKSVCMEHEDNVPSTSNNQPTLSLSQESSDSQTSRSSEGSRRKSPRKETPVDFVMEPVVRTDVIIVLPEELKNHLVTDWHCINNSKKMPILPATFTTLQVLDNYIAHEKTKSLSKQQESLLTDFIEGIREYFDSTLSSCLLYESERLQYTEFHTKNPDMLPSNIYGSVHLLRLFVKMGRMLSYSNLEGEDLESIKRRISNLLRHFSEEFSHFYNPDSYYYDSLVKQE